MAMSCRVCPGSASSMSRMTMTPLSLPCAVDGEAVGDEGALYEMPQFRDGLADGHFPGKNGVGGLKEPAEGVLRPCP